MAEALKDNLKLLGRYSILKELRRDRYTAAYLAFDPVLNREVIVKAVQLRPAAGLETAGHDRIEQAFTRQAQAAGRLLHPHIVTVFDAGRVRNVGYLALEKVDGRLLSEALAEGFRPGFLEAADIVARVADAVEYAHARGVPHGHIGASRIYLQADRSPRVMGFGGWIDTGVTGDFELAATHAMLPYFENELGVEARRKDVQALGALLFLLMTGTRPDLKALRQRRGTESAIIDLRPAAPLVLAEIAESALGLRNLRPYGTALQMRNALTAWLWGHREAQALPNAVTIVGTPSRLDIAPSSASVPLSSTKARARTVAIPPRRSRRSMAAVVATLVALTGIAYAAWHYGTPDTAPEPRSTAGVAATKPAPAATATPAPAAASTTNRTSARTTRFGPPPGTDASAEPHGEVQISADPWGEVYVDGAPRGRASPQLQFTLPAGRHTVEVRHGDRPPHVAQVEVGPDRPQRIAHRFQ
jgi:serine/threonine-protein kinase